MLQCKERKLPISDMKGEEFNNFKVISFRPTDIKDEGGTNNECSINKDDEKENYNEKIIEKIPTNNWLINSNNEDNNIDNNGKQSKKEIIYNKIMAGQCSFGNFNEASNRSTSINTDKLGEFQQSTLLQENFDSFHLSCKHSWGPVDSDFTHLVGLFGHTFFIQII